MPRRYNQDMTATYARIGELKLNKVPALKAVSMLNAEGFKTITGRKWTKSNYAQVSVKKRSPETTAGSIPHVVASSFALAPEQAAKLAENAPVKPTVTTERFDRDLLNSVYSSNMPLEAKLKFFAKTLGL